MPSMVLAASRSTLHLKGWQLAEGFTASCMHGAQNLLLCLPWTTSCAGATHESCQGLHSCLVRQAARLPQLPGVAHRPVPLQVDPRAFHILSHWNHNYTMETVLVELRKEMCKSCCANVLDACAASHDCLPGGAELSPAAVLS